MTTTRATLQTLREQLGRVLLGQDEVIEQTLIAWLAGGHVLIEGVPGLGKTLLVRALARALDGHSARIQFTPDLMPSDVTGHSLFDLKSQSFSVRRGPVFTNLLLADEINRAPAKTQSALLEVMQEYQVTIDGQSYPVARPFMVLATQNPIEQEGTYPLPEAELDRFLFKIRMPLPSAADEPAIVAAVTAPRGQASDYLDRVTPVATLADWPLWQQEVQAVHTDVAVIDYAVRVCRATREWPGLQRGAGPRGSISLVLAARARALLAGRDFVTPDDIKALGLPVLRHRVRLSAEAEIEGRDADSILGTLLDGVAAPRA